MKKLIKIIILLAVSIFMLSSCIMFSCVKKESKKTQLDKDTEVEKVNIESAEVSSESPNIIKEAEPTPKSLSESENKSEEKVKKEIKVTFIELGSVKCIPCRMMQPIMQEIEKEYSDQVKVLFYDVWTEEGRVYGEKYGIRVIPTQIFLDKDGNEYYRHEGFFPKEELIEVLKMKGVE